MTKTIRAIYSNGQITPLEPLELPDGTAVQIVVDLSETSKTDQPSPSDAAWDVFRSLASDAQPGRLQNPSVNHDEYLHGRGQ